MKKLIMTVFFFTLAIPTSFAEWDEWEDNPPETTWQERHALEPRVGNGSTLLDPITPNAYGPGINSDATGRPFRWQPDYGPSSPFLDVKPNAYGPGVGMDQFGRPVRPQP